MRRNKGCGCGLFLLFCTILGFIGLAIDYIKAHAWQFALGLLGAFILLELYLYFERSTRYSGIDIDNMEGHDFEYFCARLLKDIGYTDVSVTSGSGDHGIDVFATKDKQKYAIQCKRFNKSVPNKAVQEAYTGAAYYGGRIPVVMTNSNFTPQAINEANQIGVILWDRRTVDKMIFKAKIKTNKKEAVE